MNKKFFILSSLFLTALIAQVAAQTPSFQYGGPGFLPGIPLNGASPSFTALTVTGNTIHNGAVELTGGTASPIVSVGAPLILAPASGQSAQLKAVNNGTVVLSWSNGISYPTSGSGPGLGFAYAAPLTFGGGDTSTSTTANLTQNATFTGTRASGVNLAAFLQQTANINMGAVGNYVTGFGETLNVGGANMLGAGVAGAFGLVVNAASINTGTGAQNIGLTAKCQFGVNDGGTSGSPRGYCYGANIVASALAPATFMAQLVGLEVDTNVTLGASYQDRINTQLVYQGAANAAQGSRDDVALSVNGSITPGAGQGYKVGLSFGRAGAISTGIATDGTLISGQGNLGSGFTVGKGIDWSLGTSTGNWLTFGSVASLSGAGVLNVASYSAGGTAGLASKVCTINTTNAATGITVTITGGIVTGTTTC